MDRVLAGGGDKLTTCGCPMCAPDVMQQIETMWNSGLRKIQDVALVQKKRIPVNIVIGGGSAYSGAIDFGYPNIGDNHMYLAAFKFSGSWTSLNPDDAPQWYLKPWVNGGASDNVLGDVGLSPCAGADFTAVAAFTNYNNASKSLAIKFHPVTGFENVENCTFVGTAELWVVVGKPALHMVNGVSVLP